MIGYTVDSFIRGCPKFWKKVAPDASRLARELNNAMVESGPLVPVDRRHAPRVGTAVDFWLGVLVGDDLEGVLRRCRFAAHDRLSGRVLLFADACGRDLVSSPPPADAYVRDLRERVNAAHGSDLPDRELGRLLLMLARIEAATRTHRVDPFEWAIDSATDDADDVRRDMWRQVAEVVPDDEVAEFVDVASRLAKLLPCRDHDVVYNPILGGDRLSLGADADLFCASTLYELKCVKTLTAVHVYQLLAYAALAADHRRDGDEFVEALGLINPRYGFRAELPLAEFCHKSRAPEPEEVAADMRAELRQHG